MKRRTSKTRGAEPMWLTTGVGDARALARHPRRGDVDVGTTPYTCDGETHA